MFKCLYNHWVHLWDRESSTTWNRLAVIGNCARVIVVDSWQTSFLTWSLPFCDHSCSFPSTRRYQLWFVVRLTGRAMPYPLPGDIQHSILLRSIILELSAPSFIFNVSYLDLHISKCTNNLTYCMLVPYKRCDRYINSHESTLISIGTTAAAQLLA